LWTVLLAPLMLKDHRLTWRGGVGVLLGFVGVAVIFSHDLSPAGGGKAWLAGFVFLLAPLLSAISNLLAKRLGTGVHPLSMTAIPMLLGALCVAPLAALFETPLTTAYDAPGLLALAYLAVVGSALAFTVYYWLLRRMSVLTLSLITYTAPVVAVAVGVLMFDEHLGPHALLGSGIVLLGVVITVAVRHDGPPETGALVAESRK
jgi:drug/metabolite transporter (DMT)-like permease